MDCIKFSTWTFYMYFGHLYLYTVGNISVFIIFRLGLEQSLYRFVCFDNIGYFISGLAQISLALEWLGNPVNKRDV